MCKRKNKKKTTAFFIGISIFSGILLGYALILTLDFFRPQALPLATAYAQESSLSSALAHAEAVQEIFRKVTAEILPSIVEVSVKSEGLVGESSEGDVPWNKFFGEREELPDTSRHYKSAGLGSGVIVERQGENYYVITNGHVIDKSKEINLKLSDGSTIDAELIGHDTRKDLALLRFASPDSLWPVVTMGDSDELYVGDWVLAFGSPYGYEQSASSGIVSALGRRDGPEENINDFIQTDAPINQGSSGGALVNIYGELIGINTFITTNTGGSIGLGFAIPVNNVKTTIRQLIDKGEVRYGWLGASLGPYGSEVADSLKYEEESGVFVYQVFTDSPADKAGLLPGDLIVSLDDVPIVDTNRFIYNIGDKALGALAQVGVNRFGKQIMITIIIGERGGEEDVRNLHYRAYPGFLLVPLTPDLHEAMKIPSDVTGVLAAEIYPHTLAQVLGLQANDLITELNGFALASLKDFYQALAAVASSLQQFTVLRGGEILVLKPPREIQREQDNNPFFQENKDLE